MYLCELPLARYKLRICLLTSLSKSSENSSLDPPFENPWVFQSTNYRRTELTSDWDTLELDKKDSRMGTQESDYITQRIGVFGRYQLRCFLLVQFVGVFAAWQVLVRKIEIFLVLQWVRSQLKTGYWMTNIYLFIFHYCLLCSTRTKYRLRHRQNREVLEESDIY